MIYDGADSSFRAFAVAAFFSLRGPSPPILSLGCIAREGKTTFAGEYEYTATKDIRELLQCLKAEEAPTLYIHVNMIWDHNLKSQPRNEMCDWVQALQVAQLGRGTMIVPFHDIKQCTRCFECE